MIKEHYIVTIVIYMSCSSTRVYVHYVQTHTRGRGFVVRISVRGDVNSQIAKPNVETVVRSAEYGTLKIHMKMRQLQYLCYTVPRP